MQKIQAIVCAISYRRLYVHVRVKFQAFKIGKEIFSSYFKLKLDHFLNNDNVS